MKTHIDRVLGALAGKRFSLEDEKATQVDIAKALGDAGLAVEREVPVTSGVIDFVVTFLEPSPPPLRSMRFRHVGIEVKLKGAPAAIRRQLDGYAGEEGLDALILVTAKPVSLAPALAGKTVGVFDLGRAWL